MYNQLENQFRFQTKFRVTISDDHLGVVSVGVNVPSQKEEK